MESVPGGVRRVFAPAPQFSFTPTSTSGLPSVSTPLQTFSSAPPPTFQSNLPSPAPVPQPTTVTPYQSNLPSAPVSRSSVPVVRRVTQPTLVGVSSVAPTFGSLVSPAPVQVSLTPTFQSSLPAPPTPVLQRSIAVQPAPPRVQSAPRSQSPFLGSLAVRPRSPRVRLPSTFTIPQSLARSPSSSPVFTRSPSSSPVFTRETGPTCCVCSKPLADGGCEQAICGSCVGPYVEVGLRYSGPLPPLVSFGGEDVSNLIELVKSLYRRRAEEKGITSERIEGDAERFAELFRPVLDRHPDLTEAQASRMFGELYGYYESHGLSEDELQPLILKYGYRLATSDSSLENLVILESTGLDWGV